MKNQCDHVHETNQQVRLLPIGGQGNVIVCPRHYEAEITFRRERIAVGVLFDLPKWTDLKPYGEKE